MNPVNLIGLQSSVSDILEWLIDQFHTKVEYFLLYNCRSCNTQVESNHTLTNHWLSVNYPPVGADGTSLLHYMTVRAILEVCCDFNKLMMQTTKAKLMS